MTLIAIACKGDHAEFVTDSMSYTKNLGKLGHTSKSMLIPHLDAAVLTAGDGAFGAEAKSTVLHQSGMVQTFDDLVEAVPAWLGDLEDHLLNELGDRHLKLAPPTVFLVGWSHRRKKFDAYHLATENGFEPERISGVHVMPATWTERPTTIELNRLRDEAPDIHPGVWDEWRKKPKRPVPRGLGEWMTLGYEVRAHRTLQDFAKTIVGGRLYYTRLERGHISTMQLAEFDDHGEELDKLVGWTQHPVAQQRPCHCESGKTFLECHLAEWYADGHTCDCGSGKPFGECCMTATSTTT
ncbi:hypothetical protein [Nocardioides aquiterrae]|uniref:Uncharacterized protein n=1 Tax=Nocardioides aquiterrae TaxID=203799 RepID=A0ABN1UK96_9ACTN